MQNIFHETFDSLEGWTLTPSTVSPYYSPVIAGGDIYNGSYGNVMTNYTTYQEKAVKSFSGIDRRGDIELIIDGIFVDPGKYGDSNPINVSDIHISFIDSSDATYDRMWTIGISDLGYYNDEYNVRVLSKSINRSSGSVISNNLFQKFQYSPLPSSIGVKNIAGNFYIFIDDVLEYTRLNVGYRAYDKIEIIWRNYYTPVGFSSNIARRQIVNSIDVNNQTRTIQGYVKDSNGDPIQGVRIGSNSYVYTDSDGFYQSVTGLASYQSITAEKHGYVPSILNQPSDGTYDTVNHNFVLQEVPTVEVWTADDLNNVRNNLNYNYTQMADIDLSDYSPWIPIGVDASSSFVGNYDGNGFKILGLNVTGNPDNDGYGCGLFGYVNVDDNSFRSQIKQVVLKDVYVSGTRNVGAVVGESCYCDISECCVTGVITSADYAGGICGYFQNGEMENCYVSADVSVTGDDCGGLIADAYTASITNCYSASTISSPAGTSYVGGLIGWEGFSSIINSYFDSNIAGCSTGDYDGTPKTTAQMKSQSTYEGWDFDDVWGISPDINEGYPYLQAEIHEIPIPLPQVKQPTWADYKLTWEDVENALSYIVRLYNNAGGVVATKTIAPGMRVADFSSELSAGTFTATVQASEVAISE